MDQKNGHMLAGCMTPDGYTVDDTGAWCVHEGLCRHLERNNGGGSGWKKKERRRWIAGFLAVIMTITGVGIPLPFPSEASDIWPQKSTAPFYCLDGGKGWKKVDRYDMYKFDTMPSPLTETQAKRLFWAYPDNWSALKDAAKI